MQPRRGDGPPLQEVRGPRDRLWLELAGDGAADAEADPEAVDTVFRFDLTWLTSSWTCIFGAGCPGVDRTVPDAGCCVHGAYFSEPADEQRVATAVARLTPRSWANHAHPEHGAATDWAVADEDGDRRTATVAGACVFHNPRGFAGGHGCALHGLALAEGAAPLETKPDVCWQLPLRRTYADVERGDGSTYLQVTVTEYTRTGWGGGGADFDWYCSTSPAAHTGRVPVWRSLRDELVELVGTEVYARLDEHCSRLVGVPDRLADDDATDGPRGGTGPAGRSLLPLTVHPATVAAHAASTGPGRRGGAG